MAYFAAGQTCSFYAVNIIAGRKATKTPQNFIMLRDLKNNIRDKVWVFLKAAWKLQSGLSVVVQNDSDWFVFNEIFTNKEYDKALALLLHSRPVNPLVLDLGANVGYFSLKVADELQVAGISQFRIIAVEASAPNFATLSSRLKQPLLKDKITTICGLVGYKTGESFIAFSKQHYGNAASDAPAKTTHRAEYIDVEKLLPDTQTRISLLKCDIEGSEEIFLKEYSQLLNRVDHAVFEFHADSCNVDNCRKLLGKAGLSSKGIIKTDPVYSTSVEIFSRTS